MEHSPLRLLTPSEYDNTTTTNSAAASSQVNEFEPSVFWGVTCFLLFLLIAVCTWCCVFGKHSFSPTISISSDEVHRQHVLERQRQLEDAKKEPPEKRKRKLIQSFQRHQVKMVVRKEDLIPPTTKDNSKNKHDTTQDRVEEGLAEPNEDMALQAAYNSEDHDWESGHLQLRADGVTIIRKVPNFCAICLSSYQVGETVVWSSNDECRHAFHKDCMLDWLVNMQEGTPCPCCRQDFTDLEKYRRERRITWAAERSFNPRVFTFR